MIGRFCTRLHENEDGPPELSTILMLGLVVLPLVGLLIFFGNDLVELAKTAWEEITGNPVQQ